MYEVSHGTSIRPGMSDGQDQPESPLIERKRWIVEHNSIRIEADSEASTISSGS